MVLHYGNDLALWDQLFGSFANPPTFAGEVGFGRSAIRSLPAMFAFADGSVRFLKEKRPLPIFQAMATRSGGEVLSADVF